MPRVLIWNPALIPQFKNKKHHAKNTRVPTHSLLFVASATRGCDRRRRTGVAATGRPGGRSTKEGEDRGRGRVRSSPRQLYGRRRREGRGVDLSLGFCRRLRVTAHLLCSIRLCHFCFDLVGSVFVQSVSQSYFSHPPTRRRRRFLCQSNHLCMLQLPQTRWWVSGGESSGYNSTRVQSSSSLFAV